MTKAMSNYKMKTIIIMMVVFVHNVFLIINRYVNSTDQETLIAIIIILLITICLLASLVYVCLPWEKNIPVFIHNISLSFMFSKNAFSDKLCKTYNESKLQVFLNSNDSDKYKNSFISFSVMQISYVIGLCALYIVIWCTVPSYAIKIIPNYIFDLTIFIIGINIARGVSKYFDYFNLYKSIKTKDFNGLAHLMNIYKKEIENQKYNDYVFPQFIITLRECHKDLLESEN
jgi:hypothetical protein